MGMFDWVTHQGAPEPREGDPAPYQSKDGPCVLEVLDRDATDERGVWLINEYYGQGGHWRRGMGGWVRVG